MSFKRLSLLLVSILCFVQASTDAADTGDPVLRAKSAERGTRSRGIGPKSPGRGGHHGHGRWGHRGDEFGDRAQWQQRRAAREAERKARFDKIDGELEAIKAQLVSIEGKLDSHIA